MRFCCWFLLLCLPVFGEIPADLQAALERFRAEPPTGWSFVQTSTGDGQSMVERCDGARAEFQRWTLLEKDGRPPTAEELVRYAETRSRRSRGGTAPRLVDQFDLATLETVAEQGDRATFRCRLRPAEAGDHTAAHLRATFVLHRPTRTLETIELANTGPFRPTLAVSIQEMVTQLAYSLPEGDRPSLPQRVVTRVRGTAFWFKSLDSERTITYSAYARRQ